MEEDDPVVNEVLTVHLKHRLLKKICILLQANVYLSHALAEQLCILQVLGNTWHGTLSVCGLS